jgi:cytochrome c-type biogenesis protein CcmH
LLALGAVLLAVACASEPSNTQKAIEERLTCQCGCGLTVHTCNHLQCGFAVPVRKEIAQSLADGLTADEIIERYTAKYGEKILSSPIPRGFNLVAWFGPYVALVVAGVLIFVVIRKWSPATARGDGEAGPDGADPGLSDAQKKTIDRALEDYDQ